jgi:hypothetical protein
MDGQKSFTSDLPSLPKEAPFPEGTGCAIPYPEISTEGTKGLKVMAYVNHFPIITLPIVAIYE